MLQSRKKLPEFSSRKQIMTQIHLEILTEVLRKDQVHTKSSQFVRVRLMVFLKFLAHANMHENFSHAIEIC